MNVIASAEIERRYRSVAERVERAARRAGRTAESVRIVLASKMQPADALRAAYRAGARTFGENYVQEAIAKRRDLADLQIEWHLIGHLQSNKAGLAAQNFALLHSLDSLRLAAALARLDRNRRMPVLIEVNLGAEQSKSGVAQDAVEAIIDGARDLVDIRGLMAIPPPQPDSTRARPYFCALRALGERLAARTGIRLSELSMGMSGDFEAAIEEGATMVRIGTAVFGSRST